MMNDHANLQLTKKKTNALFVTGLIRITIDFNAK